MEMVYEKLIEEVHATENTVSANRAAPSDSAESGTNGEKGGFSFDSSALDTDDTASNDDEPAQSDTAASGGIDVSAFDDFDDFGDFEDIGASAQSAAPQPAEPEASDDNAYDEEVASGIFDKIAAAMRTSASEKNDSDTDGIFDDTLGEPENITEDAPLDSDDGGSVPDGGFDFDFSVFEDTPAPRAVPEKEDKKKRKGKKKR